MNKVKILLHGLFYPLAMLRYFEKALKHNPNIELKSAGVYTGSWIPWSNEQHPSGMYLPEKYAKPPDIPVSLPPDIKLINYDLVKAQLGDWKPDIVLTVDAGVNWVSKPSDGMSVTIGTDPHVLDYSHARKVSDNFFNMQKFYSEPDDIYLPYAYSVYDHFQNELIIKDLDAVLIGLQYTHVPRVQWIEELRKRDISVFTENGPVFDEYRDLANRARIGLNWSSMNDLNARFFENAAFGLAPVMNIVPDAHLFLTEGEDYLGFTNLNEAIEKVLYLKENPEQIIRLSQNAYSKIRPHTYDARIEQLLKECGF